MNILKVRSWAAALVLLCACGQEAETVVQPEEDFFPEVSVEAQGELAAEEQAGEEVEQLDVQHFGMFISETLDGELIDDSIFTQYDLTMVNIWATWCMPCVDEMPYLAEVSQQLPEGVNFITMCADGDKEPDLAREIVSKSGGDFTVVLPSDSLNLNVMTKVAAYPTTVFVDGNGNVAAVITGVPQGDVVATYLDYIDQVLTMLEEMNIRYGGELS